MALGAPFDALLQLDIRLLGDIFTRCVRRPNWPGTRHGRTLRAMNRRTRVVTSTIFIISGIALVVAGVAIFAQQPRSIDTITQGAVFLVSGLLIPAVGAAIVRRLFR